MPAANRTLAFPYLTMLDAKRLRPSDASSAMPKTRDALLQRKALLARVSAKLKCRQRGLPANIRAEVGLQDVLTESLLTLWGVDSSLYLKSVPEDKQLAVLRHKRARMDAYTVSKPTLEDIIRDRDATRRQMDLMDELNAEGQASKTAPPGGLQRALSACLRLQDSITEHLSHPDYFDFPKRQLTFTARHIRTLTEWIRLHDLRPADVYSLLTLPSPLCLFKACYNPELVRNCQSPKDWHTSPPIAPASSPAPASTGGAILQPPHSSPSDPTTTPDSQNPSPYPPLPTVSFTPIVPQPLSYLIYACNTPRCPTINEQKLMMMENLEFFESAPLLKRLALIRDADYAKLQYTGFVRLQQAAIALLMTKAYKLPEWRRTEK